MAIGVLDDQSQRDIDAQAGLPGKLGRTLMGWIQVIEEDG